MSKWTGLPFQAQVEAINSKRNEDNYFCKYTGLEFQKKMDNQMFHTESALMHCFNEFEVTPPPGRRKYFVP